MSVKQLPDWLNEQREVFLPTARNRWRRRDYLDKTLLRIQQIMAEDTNSLRLNHHKAFLQQLDPTVKFFGALALLLAIALTKELSFLLDVNVLLFIAAWKSGVKPFAFLLRVWLPILLFVGLAVLPGITSIITPGEPIWLLYHGPSWSIGNWSLPSEISITRQGTKSAFFVIFRATASLGLTTILIKTTRWSLLTQTLAKIGLPSIFVTVLDLTYRYIYVFLLLLTEYVLGRKSRLVGSESQDTKIAWIGSTISAFFRMIWDYSQEINDAMRSRGYSDEHKSTEPSTFKMREFYFALFVMLLCYCAYGGIFSGIFGFI